MNKRLIILSIMVLGVLCSDLQHQLVNGLYNPSNEQVFSLYLKYRPSGTMLDSSFLHFKENLKQIASINSNPSSTWQAGINEFAFISEAEFKSQYLGAQNCSATAELTLRQKENEKHNSAKNQISDIELPSTMDWRDFGVVSTVKNQQGCGSCWTFSTVGALESHWALKTKTSPPLLSEQQLLDCAGSFNNFGCSGGLPSQAFEYIKFTGGINSEEVYPYMAIDTPTCQFNKNSISATVPGGSFNITAYDEVELKQKMALEGPITISFAVYGDFRFYSTGVYNDPTCPPGPDTVNHAVLGVGYGNEQNMDYWLVRNSWSEKWGDQGYFKILRGNNTCGVSVCASFPLLSAQSIV